MVVKHTPLPSSGYPDWGAALLFSAGGCEMTFELAYEEFIRHHIKSRHGEARRRLSEGLGHAEQLFLQQVWWPAFSNFEI
jgi:hypothetical protein